VPERTRPTDRGRRKGRRRRRRWKRRAAPPGGRVVQLKKGRNIERERERAFGPKERETG
jgi:hypothetical protein